MVEDRESMLAELLCARLCHDLAGAIGAVGTGAELLGEDESPGGIAGEALDLLTASAAMAVNRLRFLRLALGSGGGGMTSAALRELTANFLATPVGGREEFRLDWSDAGRTFWDADSAKLLLNVILLARDSLPRGGVIAVKAQPAPEGIVSVTAEGPAAGPGDAAAALQADEPFGLGPRGVQGYYTARVAARLGVELRQTRTAQGVTFSAVQQ